MKSCKKLMRRMVYYIELRDGFWDEGRVADGVQVIDSVLARGEEVVCRLILAGVHACDQMKIMCNCFVYWYCTVNHM